MPSTKCRYAWCDLFAMRADTRGSEAEKKFKAEMRSFAESVAAFFRERLEFYLKRFCGYPYDVVKAVLAADAEDVMDAVRSSRSGEEVLDMPEFLAIGRRPNVFATF